MEEKKDSETTENPKEKKNKLILMKRGDYSVHVLIEEVKNCEQKDPNSLPFPVVKLTCFGRTQRSEKPNSPCADYQINEHFYFEGSNLTVEQLDSSKLLIEVYDSGCSRERSDFLGIYEYDLEYIYNQPGHALQNFWLALANPESDNMTKVRGFLKLSVSVLHEEDPRVELKLNPNSTDCMVPSQIKMEYKIVSLHIFRGEELPEMEKDPNKKGVDRNFEGYIEAQYLGIKKRTSVVKMKNNIVLWNEVIDIPVSIPAVSQKIVLIIKHNKTIVGSIEIKIDDVLEKGCFQNYSYFNIYGSPKFKNGGVYDLMNYNSEYGSRWSGRVLMKITTQNSDNPVAKVSSIDDKKMLEEAANICSKNPWCLRIKLYSAFYLPGQDKEYSIRVSIQEKEESFKGDKAVNGTINWGKVKTLQFNTVTDKKEELPDLFIYLLEGSNRICFQRIPVSEFYKNQDIVIIKLLPDPCIGIVKYPYESGLLKIKLCLFNILTEKIPEWREGDSDSDSDNDADEGQKENKKEEEDLENLLRGEDGGIPGNLKIKETCAVVCNVYMSRDLISGDSNGTNDPYVVLKCFDNEQKTEIKNNTINGIWNEKLIFDNVEMVLKKKGTWPIFMLKVLDYDKIGKDDLLGHSLIWLTDMNYSINETKISNPPVWQQLFSPKGNQKQGQILLYFYIFDNQHRNLINDINPYPEMTPYSFEINILGLRDLKPLSLLPVKKAFIKFDMNSLNMSGESQDNIQPIKTQPKDNGDNPNINTVIKFDIKLPKEEIFIPQLQCEVYDQLLSGMLNPLLGVFLLDLKSLVRQTHRQIDEDLGEVKKKIGMFLAQGLIVKKFSGPIQAMNESQSDNQSGDAVIKMETKKTKISEFIYTKQIIDENKNNPNYFVLLPQFKTFVIPGVKRGTVNYKEYQVEDESLAPPSSEYFPIGYIARKEKQENERGEFVEVDLTLQTNTKKHYRRFYGMELEHVKELGLRSPFTKSSMRRKDEGNKEDEMCIFTAITDPNNKIIKKYSKEELDDKTPEEKKRQKRELRRKEREEREKKTGFRGVKNDKFGRFKGVIRICEKNKMNEYNKIVNEYKAKDSSMIKALKNLNKYEKLTRSILVKTSVVIRVYILELKELVEKDINSASDPYVKIYLGSKLKFDEKKNYIEDAVNAKWYKYYDIVSEFPGDSTLRIEVWDYDPIFSDELIGLTKIDLEDRYFNDKWREMKYKPIEVRKLIHPDLTRSAGKQGLIYLWVEIIDKKDFFTSEPWQIEPEPESKVEVRFIVYETEGMPNMDVEGTSDLYVTGFIDPKLKQSTDVHFRCQTGCGSFNWRMVLPVTLPDSQTKLNIQVYDNDIFSKDDYICSSTIELKGILKIVKNLDVPVSFTKDYVDGLSPMEKSEYDNIKFMSKSEDETQTKFWIQCYKDGVSQGLGRVLCSLEVLPMWKANVCKVGLGRSEPNISPYLPPPVGRLEFSLNPIKMLNQCVGPRFRRKLYCTVCLVCLGVYLVCLIPYIILYISGEIVNPFNYK